jgi:protein tyrosine/serine phosphatase
VFKKTFSKPLAAVAVLFLTIVSAQAALPVQNLPNIKNFGRVTDSYYRGSLPENENYTELASFGIKTVINLIGDASDHKEKSMVENAGMSYFYIPMTTHEAPTAAKLDEFLKIVNDPVAQPVYVHCVGGKHRTGVMTAIYRMTQGWTADQAFQEMKQYKFGADFLHSEFKRFVFDYYNQLAKTKPAPVGTVVTAASKAS